MLCAIAVEGRQANAQVQLVTAMYSPNSNPRKSPGPLATSPALDDDFLSHCVLLCGRLVIDYLLRFDV